nr:YdcF family protein [uncultured Carboxylicivirga sp.]
MFFILSKLLSFLVYPFNWSLLLIISAQLIKNRKARRRLRIGAIVNLIIFSNTAFFQLVTSKWETQYSIPQLSDNQSYNIIVLGGYSNMDEETQQISFNQAADRLLQALPIYYLNNSNRIIITGGTANIYFDETPEADYMLKYLESINIDQSNILIESKSRNTYENAINTGKIIDSLNSTRQNVLITSAFHMPRAKGCFDKLNIEVIPYPTQPLRSLTTLKPIDYFLPSINTLNTWSILIKEWLGITMYWFKSYL